MRHDPIFVLLGAHGDIAVGLPALKRWSDENGRPAVLMVAKEYAPFLEGVSYVKPVIWDGSFHDAWAALSYLKTDLPQIPVKCLQFYGNGDEKVLPSFQHEMEYLGGILGEDLPLVFDRRNSEREAELLACHDDGRPMILVCVKGKSSPFKDADKFMEGIIEALPDCNVIDLADVKAERVFDLLGLYDKAAALISVDTVHLHLSKASNVPTFAIARDYPTRWHGTPWHPRFKFYCRYSAALERLPELIESMTQERPALEPILSVPKGSYNPSIIDYEGETLVSVRHHPGRTWKSQLILDGLPVNFPFPVSLCAHEDMRLFKWGDKLMGCYVCVRGTRIRPKCVIGYGELIRTPETWFVREHFQPLYGRNDWSGMEKNWVFFEA